MNTLRNKVQLIGNLGNNPEVISLESGKKLVKFSLATNDSYKNAKGEKVVDTQWHNIIAWNKTAEIIEEYVIKGSEIAIEGKVPKGFKEMDLGSCSQDGVINRGVYRFKKHLGARLSKKYYLEYKF